MVTDYQSEKYDHNISHSIYLSGVYLKLLVNETTIRMSAFYMVNEEDCFNFK